MRGDEAKLIAAGEEAKEDQRIGRIAECLHQDRAHAFLKLRAAGTFGRAQHRQEEDGAKDDPREDDKDRLPRKLRQQDLCQGRADDLPGRPRRRRDPQRERTVLVARGAADDRKDDAEPGPGDAEADEDLKHLMLHRRHRARRQDKPGRIAERAKDDGQPVAPPFGDGAEDRLPDAPGQVLDRDGQRKLRPGPAEFLGDRDLEHAKARPDRETQHDDDGPADQDRREDRATGFHGPLL